MFVTICIFAGIGLIICGIKIMSATNKRRNISSISNSIALPPRTSEDESTLHVSQNKGRRGYPSITPALPPRRNTLQNTSGNNRGHMMIRRGPRGILPEQFPCCPIDHSRNVAGSAQIIFWDSGASCYWCSRGHKFKSNGRIL